MTDPVIVHFYKIDYAADGVFDGKLDDIAQSNTGELYLMKKNGGEISYEKITSEKREWRNNTYYYNRNMKIFDIDGDKIADLVRAEKHVDYLVASSSRSDFFDLLSYSEGYKDVVDEINGHTHTGYLDMNYDRIPDLLTAEPTNDKNIFINSICLAPTE